MTKGGMIPDLHLLNEAAGRTLGDEDAELLWIRANEYAKPIPNRLVKERAGKVAKLADKLATELADPPDALLALGTLVPLENLNRLAHYARRIGELHAERIGRGKPAASEDMLLDDVAWQALTAWRNAGGDGLGVHWDNYAERDVGPVLDLIRAALEMASADVPSSSTIKSAVRKADRKP